MGDMTVGENSVNPLPDGTSRTTREPEKKDPLRGSFFSYRPSAGAALWSVLMITQLCTQNVCTKVPLALWSVLVGKSQHTTTT